jgi:16S rRNA processing protein RimM
VSSSTSSTEKSSDWLVAGRVGRPHGLDGSFHVQRPRAELLARGASVIVAGSECEIVRRAGTDARPIVALAGCADRAGADGLRGEELLVARSAAPALDEDEFYAEELEGCHVHDAEVEVGVVRRLLALPSCEVLEVARAGGGADLLVPMVRDAVRDVDLAQRRIEVDLVFLGER